MSVRDGDSEMNEFVVSTVLHVAARHRSYFLVSIERASQLLFAYHAGGGIRGNEYAVAKDDARRMKRTAMNGENDNRFWLVMAISHARYETVD